MKYSKTLVFLTLTLLIIEMPSAYAAQLFGVTGDGAPVNAESFFSVSIVDASTDLIQPLGNGDDGESIAFNSADGLMYHWSGLGDQIMETINLNDQAVTNITTGGSAPVSDGRSATLPSNLSASVSTSQRR